MANEDTDKDLLKTASQSKPETVPSEEFLSAMGIAKSPTENVAVAPTPKQEPVKPEPTAQALESNPPPTLEQKEQVKEEIKKWLGKFESPDELEKYAQELETSKANAETENQLLRKEWDKYLQTLSVQPNIGQGKIEQAPYQPPSTQAKLDDFSVTDEEINEIMNVDAKAGFNKVFKRFISENAPKLINLTRQEQLQQMEQQTRAKQIHDTFYGTYGNRIKAVLPEEVSLDSAKPIVKLAWDLVYNQLPNEVYRQQADLNPIPLFPKVADETIKLITMFQKKNGNANPQSDKTAVADTAKAPVLSGVGARQVQKKTGKSEYDDMVEWYLKERA